jgi:hypothetical protein
MQLRNPTTGRCRGDFVRWLTGQAPMTSASPPPTVRVGRGFTTSCILHLLISRRKVSQWQSAQGGEHEGDRGPG